jgi:hypothetical protein
LHLVGYIGILLGAHPILHISRIRVKMLLHVSVNKPSSWSLLPCFAKVMVIKIIITLIKHSSKLPDDGLLTETCRSVLM